MFSSESELDAERQNWSTDDSAGALASPLKLPLNGVRSGTTATFVLQGNRGFYWTSSLSTSATNPNYSRYLDFATSSVFVNIPRGAGMAVRCIKQ